MALNQIFRITQTDADRWIAAPAIVSLTLVRNWSNEALVALKKAIDKLLELNPILTGRLVRNPATNELTVECGKHSNFFNVIQGPSDFTVPSNLDERIHAMQLEIEPLFDIIGLSLEQIETGSKLFGVTVCTLPDDHACYVIQLSHMIADGATYYMLLAQLQSLLDEQDIELIRKYKWAPSPDNVLTPSFYTSEDKYRELKSWRPGFMKLAHGGMPRTSSIAVVSSEQISKLKPGLVRASEGTGNPVKFLSTNDILMAALAEVFESELMVMYANMRGRIHKVTHDLAANAERGIFFPRNLARSAPQYIRTVLMRHFCAWSNSDDMRRFDSAYLASDFSTVTNWSQLVTFVLPKDVELLAHAPASSFVKS